MSAHILLNANQCRMAKMESIQTLTQWPCEILPITTNRGF
jgi:hypothetical protein